MKTIHTALATLIVVAAAMLGASADARFLANDPVPFDPNNPAQFNRYAYGWNDPINMVDPDGRLSCAANAACDPASFYGGIPSGFRSNVTGADRAGALTSGAAMSGLAGAAACASGGCAGAAILGGEVLAGEALGPAGAAGLGAAGATALTRTGAIDSVVDHGEGLVEATINVARGKAEVLGEVSMQGSTTRISGAHVQGDGTMRELVGAAREFGGANGASEVVIEGAARTTGARPGHTPRPITVKIEDDL